MKGLLTSVLALLSVALFSAGIDGPANSAPHSSLTNYSDLAITNFPIAIKEQEVFLIITNCAVLKFNGHIIPILTPDQATIVTNRMKRFLKYETVSFLAEKP